MGLLKYIYNIMGLLDTRASRSKARADVAELYVTLAEEIQTEKKFVKIY